MLSLVRRINPIADHFSSDEERFEWQMNQRANYLLIGDKLPHIIVDVYAPLDELLKSNIRWINKDELIAGSFLCNAVHGAQEIECKDVDIYFKSKDNVLEFLNRNPQIRLTHSPMKAKVAFIAQDVSNQFNLIFGVHYDSPADLISHFDIRACSIAYDPQTNTLHSVRGSLDDCAHLRIVYNTVPHNTTIARLIKYTQKGFHIDAYQRLFLAELIRSDQYNAELEITTGYRATEDEE